MGITITKTRCGRVRIEMSVEDATALQTITANTEGPTDLLYLGAEKVKLPQKILYTKTKEDKLTAARAICSHIYDGLSKLGIHS